MNWLIRQSGVARGLFVAATLLILSIRLLVPTGYMPVAADGHMVIQLCTGAGPATMALDFGKTAPTSGDQHKAGDGLCVFACAFAGGLLAPLLLVLLPALALARLPHGAAIADLTVHRLAAPPPPAIGPPLTI